MDEPTASLIVRMAAALNNNMEACGAPQDTDTQVIARALAIAPQVVEPSYLWWAPGYSKADQAIFADPWKRCVTCQRWVDGFYRESGRLVDCGHKDYTSVCASWSPVDGCTCTARGWSHPFRKPQPWDKRTY